MTEHFLANENFPATTVAWLRKQGHNVVHAAESLVGEKDERLLEVAKNEDRILLTFDRDFGELVFHQSILPAKGIVLFRLKQQPPSIVLPFLESFFLSATELKGYFTVAAPGHFRQTPLHR